MITNREMLYIWKTTEEESKFLVKAGLKLLCADTNCWSTLVFETEMDKRDGGQSTYQKVIPILPSEFRSPEIQFIAT